MRKKALAASLLAPLVLLLVAMALEGRNQPAGAFDNNAKVGYKLRSGEQRGWQIGT